MLVYYMIIMYLTGIVANERQNKRLSLLPTMIDSSYQDIQPPQQRRRYLEEDATPKYKKHTNLHEETDEDDLNKKWLLMVESEKTDEEDVKKITPKSVFIAPMLTRSACREGYRFDHVGRCVKLIKLDPAAQLDYLLKRLNEMYNKANSEEEKDIAPPSSGPLHFSFPIEKEKYVMEPENSTSVVESSVVESKVNFTVTVKKPTLDEKTEKNDTLKTDTAYDTLPESGSGESEMFEVKDGTDLESQYMVIDGTTTSEVPTTETDTTELTTLEFTTEQMTAETTEKEETTTETQTETSTLPLDVISSNDTEVTVEKQNLSYVRFPEDDRIHFPGKNNKFDSNSGSKFMPILHFNVDTQADFSSDDSVKFDRDSVDKKQFWWLPEHWRYNEEVKENPSLLNFWSKMPLVKDVSFVELSNPPSKNTGIYEYGVEREVPLRRTPTWSFPTTGRFIPSQSHTEVFKPSPQVIYESFTHKNPWIKRTNHERHRHEHYVRPSGIYFRKTISS